MNRTRIKSIVFSLLGAGAALFAITGGQSAAAQTGVELRPILRAGQEARFSVSALVDTQITAQGAGGLAGSVHQELTATLLIKAGVPAPPVLSSGSTAPSGTAVVDNGNGVGDLVYYEVTIEAAAAKSVVDGIEKPLVSPDLPGKKMEFAVDSAGAIVKFALPGEAATVGLGDLIFSMTNWAPAATVSAGQTWGPAPGEQIRGAFGYVSTRALSRIFRGAQTSYKLTSLTSNRALVDGTISFNEQGGSSIEIPNGPTKVNATTSGTGTTRIEYDTSAGRLATAVSETLLKGRLVNIPPTRPGEPMQPREGAVVETSKFSVTLIP